MSEQNQKTYARIRSFVMRSGRMTESQQRDYSTLRDRWCLPYNEELLNYSDIFSNTNDVFAEIGFGMGHAISELAQTNPDKNYLGIEVHKPGVGRLLSDIKHYALTNIFVIEHDAVEVLESMIGDNSIRGFHVFFPDPWPKKKHHKRRLLQEYFLELLAKKLCNDGYIYIVTDWQEYADFVLEEAKNISLLRNKYKDFAPAQAWRPQTNFEKKGKKAGRNICELLFEKHV